MAYQILQANQCVASILYKCQGMRRKGRWGWSTGNTENLPDKGCAHPLWLTQQLDGLGGKNKATTVVFNFLMIHTLLRLNAKEIIKRKTWSSHSVQLVIQKIQWAHDITTSSEIDITCYDAYWPTTAWYSLQSGGDNINAKPLWHNTSIMHWMACLNLDRLCCNIDFFFLNSSKLINFMLHYLFTIPIMWFQVPFCKCCSLTDVTGYWSGFITCKT